MIPRFSLVLALLGAPAFGAWDRLFTDSVQRTDTPPPHNLSYFKSSACADVGTKDRTKRCTARTELKQIGSAGKFTLFDLDYYFPSEIDPPERFGAESVLLQSSPGVFHELLFRGPFLDVPKSSGYAVSPAGMAVSGNATILIASTDPGGMYHAIDQDFFALGESGLKPMDPKPVFDAAAMALPEDEFIWHPAQRIDFDKGIWEWGTEPKNSNVGPKVGCCPGAVYCPIQN